MTALQKLNKAAWLAVREALKSGSPNLAVLKHIALKTDDMVDRAVKAKPKRELKKPPEDCFPVDFDESFEGKS